MKSSEKPVVEKFYFSSHGNLIVKEVKTYPNRTEEVYYQHKLFNSFDRKPLTREQFLLLQQEYSLKTSPFNNPTEHPQGSSLGKIDCYFTL